MNPVPIYACTICRKDHRKSELIERRAGNRLIRYCPKCWQFRLRGLSRMEVRT